jgi:hypothetical protein
LYTAGNKDYQKLSRECVKFRHLLANMPKPTYKDRQDLEDKEAALQAGAVLRIRIQPEFGIRIQNWLSQIRIRGFYGKKASSYKNL